VRRAASVNVNLKRGIFLQQGAGGTGVIQVNVSEQDGIQVRHAKALHGELFPKRGQRGSRAGVDQRGKIIGPEQRGGDAPGLPSPIQVKQSRSNHRG
jgi:hypothetical protein